MVVPGNEYDSARLWELLCQAMETVVPGYGNRSVKPEALPYGGK